MSIPANVRVNIGAPFPSQVKGNPQGLIAVQKANGIWTVTLNYGAFAPSPIINDPANSVLLVYNTVTRVYSLVPVAQASASLKYVSLVAAGPYAALPADDVILVKFTPMAITVDWSQRVKPLRVVDAKGDAGANNITITPTLGQTQLAQVNYVYTIDNNGGSIKLTPLPDGTGGY